jgi:hypothetical protein
MSPEKPATASLNCLGKKKRIWEFSTSAHRTFFVEGVFVAARR